MGVISFLDFAAVEMGSTLDARSLQGKPCILLHKGAEIFSVLVGLRWWFPTFSLQQNHPGAGEDRLRDLYPGLRNHSSWPGMIFSISISLSDTPPVLVTFLWL